jgi:ATP-dependent RNA helicase RhlE
MKLFSELSLCSRLQSNLAKHGFVQTTAVQAEAIPPALAGQDVVATAQTGTGKTLAFLLPLLQSLADGHGKGGVKALILSPTRELAIQTHETFVQAAEGMGIQAAVAMGGQSEGQQLRAIRRGAQVLIATPGRLCDYLERHLVDLRGVQCFVLDEADRMLDMGFLPSLRMILKAVPASRQTLFFSATIEKSVAHLIDQYVRNPVRVAVGSATTPPSEVNLNVYEVESDRKLSLLTNLIEHETGTFLVFARTKHGTDRLAKNLVRTGVKAARIHGGRTQNQRNQALNGFKDGQYRILVATDVAARGIHVEGIAHVVNYDLPQVPEDFIHRVGRTGRAGAHGTASTFCTRSERSEIRRIERTLNVHLTPRKVDEDLPRQPQPAAKVIRVHIDSKHRAARSFASGGRKTERR